MKPLRFVIGADNHGDMIDPIAGEAILSFIKDYKPQVRIHLGDAFDFRNLRKGASDDEKAASLHDDWEMGYEFLRKFYDKGERNEFLRGNHDERIYDLQSSAVGVIRDFAEDGCKKFDQLIKRCKATMLPYDSRLGVLRIGHLKAIHGYASGRNAGAVHARVYRHCFYGHTHAIDVTPVESDDGQKEARGIGCLCKTDMPYNSRMTAKLRHNNGWVSGVIFENGTYQAWQTTRIGDNFYAPKEIQTY